MNVTVRIPWTHDAFFAWEGHQHGRYEFDGTQPVDMVGVNIRHGLIGQNVAFALRSRLRESKWRVLGSGCGIETQAGAIRYPDALVTRGPLPGTAYLVADPVIVFEVVSPTSGRTDRIVKVAEYACIPALRRYVIIEPSGLGVTVLTRTDPAERWSLTTLATASDILDLSELGCELPLSEIYEGVSFDTAVLES